jgi:hypothetical protein
MCDENSSGSNSSHMSIAAAGLATRNVRDKSSLARNQSDGSDREETDDDYLNEQLYSNSTIGERDYLDQLLGEESGNENTNGDQTTTHDDHIIPRVPLRNTYVRLDRVTPRIIKMMNEREKDCYINMCRDLYSVIYEI